MINDMEEGDEEKSDLSDADPLNRSTKRSRLERYLEILKVVSDHGPIKRTHILYRANLAWSQLRDSLETLENADALSQVVTKKGVFYEITETGKKILSYYADVQSSLNRMTTETPRNIGKSV